MYVQFLMRQYKTKKISISKVEEMHGLGTPEDLETFLQTKIYKYS
jgi:hypothetical protein